MKHAELVTQAIVGLVAFPAVGPTMRSFRVRGNLEDITGELGSLYPPVALLEYPQFKVEVNYI